MTSFISQILGELLSREEKISNYTFILPSKRAGSYLIHQLALMSGNALFVPKILSIEDFAREVSELKPVDNISALFEFYTAYLACTPEEKAEDFETFSAWAQTLLYDFNEIDRYLIDYKSFFGYLGSIQEMNHWYLQEERTELMENYLRFWETLPRYYEELKSQLNKKNMAYQGMVYRKASEEIARYIEQQSGPFVFIGFNALNNAEQTIFQKMLASGKAEVFWDIDEVFLNDEQHDVSIFMREYLKKWPYYKENVFKQVSSDYAVKKKIDVVGVPKNIGQAKLVGDILSRMSQDEVQQTAVVLGDENLLLPVLNSLPPDVGEVNITMGFSLKNAPVNLLFEHLLKMHSARFTGEWYFKDVTVVCSHPLFQRVTGGMSARLSEKIKKENLIYVSSKELIEAASETTQPLYKLFFGNWDDNALKAVENLQEVVYELKRALDVDKDKLTLEFLYQFHLLFNQMSNLLSQYPYVKNIKTLFSIYRDLLSSKTVDFRGKPFSGLQLMGMLESRVLDFKNVILTSVNEGVLPAGKSANSYIPFDLKCAYNLPTYKEKDAVYTYHFYHLLQRAEQVHLLYNTESDGLNAGEKSRFLRQLEMEQQKNHTLKQSRMVPQVPAIQKDLKVVHKTREMLERIKERAADGFSPSALTTYIRNPLDFYKQYVLNLKETEEVEETVAYNTLGNVVHDTLEGFYGKWIGRELSTEMLEAALKSVPEEIQKQFRKHYTQAPINAGKNLLIFEVAKRYVTNFLKTEIRSVKKGNTIRILQIEEKSGCQLPIPELDFPVKLRGTVDRVDEFNGKLRIIDYKTGRVDQGKVEIIDWNDIGSDYDRYSKPFQILTYACLLDDKQKIHDPVEAGIISFKNLQGGFLKFTKKDKAGRGAKKDSDIDQEILVAFKEELKKLILEICDPEVPFIEKEIKQNAW